MKIHGTAKGGALSTKDFGVAFGGAAAPSFVCQEATGDYLGLGGASATRTKAGVRVLSSNSALGKSVTEIKFYMKKNGSPTGTVNLAVYNGGVDQSVGGSSINAATELTTSYQLITFTMSARTIIENDDIVLEGGTVNNDNQVALSEASTNDTYDDQIGVEYTTNYGWQTGEPYLAERNMYWCYLGS